MSWLKSVLSSVAIWAGSRVVQLDDPRLDLVDVDRRRPTASICSPIFFMFSGDAITVTCLSETWEIVLTVSGDSAAATAVRTVGTSRRTCGSPSPPRRTARRCSA